MIREEDIGFATSESQANRILDEIAIAGSYTAKAFVDDFMVYHREKEGITETITIERQNPRKFRIYKRIEGGENQVNEQGLKKALSEVLGLKKIIEGD